VIRKLPSKALTLNVSSDLLIELLIAHKQIVNRLCCADEVYQPSGAKDEEASAFLSLAEIELVDAEDPEVKRQEGCYHPIFVIR